MSDPQPPQGVPLDFAVEVPPELEAGVYADFAAIWHVPTHFVIDFSVPKSTPDVTVDGSGQPTKATMPAKVVARIRIQPQQVIELARGLSAQLDMWESEQGHTRPPG